MWKWITRYPEAYRMPDAMNLVVHEEPSFEGNKNDSLPLEVTQHFKSGGSFWMMINPYLPVLPPFLDSFPFIWGSFPRP